MSETVIKVENLSKQYRLGLVGTGTLSHDLNRWWAKVRGKEDPFFKVGEVNVSDEKGISEYVWALKDINFEVKQGEVLGIIGKNGAGKSTLLKILSRVTGPTTGTAKVKGRIASLLEVGTGFHPELTGRENIFLNGAILGMTKPEIKSKFDEIVTFSGVERYIDTPVKRYSSGMYVRLAFAVAAHLEPEILVVDEVLAVGDAEFQKKCLGKMKDVAGEGRTVLFVSHNMGAVSNLCSRTILLKEGNIIANGITDEVINEYTSIYNLDSVYEKTKGENNLVFVQKVYTNVSGNGISDNLIYYSKPFNVVIEYQVDEPIRNWYVAINIRTLNDVKAFTTADFDENPELLGSRKPGKFKTMVKIPARWLNPKKYKVVVFLVDSLTKEKFEVIEAISFEILDDGSPTKKYGMGDRNKLSGILQPYLKWQTERIT